MPGNEVLLDTNAVASYMNGEPGIAEILGTAAKAYLPSIVLGELYYGALNSTRIEENLSRIRTFAGLCENIAVDTTTAWEFAKIRASLKRKGRPLPENDLWIAALARQYSLSLITKDQHFQDIEGVRAQAW